MSVVVEVLANDTDPDGDELQLASVGAPAHGTATARADDSVMYVPAAGFDGSDTFNYTVSDGNGGTDTASVSITVMPPAPPASGDALLDRIAQAPEGSWLKVNVNRFDEVWTPVAQRAQVNGVPFGEPRKIIAAWGSMTWDANRRQLILWGGGHANYAGNEVYRFDAATLRWQRASLPSAVAPRFGDRRFFAVDGAMNAPISSHTFDNQEFLPRADRFITFGGASYNAGRVFLLDDGVTRTGPYLWDPSRADANKVGGTTGSAILSGVLGGRMWMNRNALVVNGSGASRPDALGQRHLGVRVRGGRGIDPRERVAAERRRSLPLPHRRPRGSDARSLGADRPGAAHVLRPGRRCLRPDRTGCTCAPRRWARATGS